MFCVFLRFCVFFAPFLLSVRRFIAGAWVDRSGRGFNPRPAQIDWNEPPTHNLGNRNQLSGIKLISVNCALFSAFRPPLHCLRVGGSFRSGVQPPTGTRPTGSEMEINCQELNSSPQLRLIFCFPSAASLLARGWIVPVGGSTPDRHQADRLRPAPGRPAQTGSGRVGFGFGWGWGF